MTPLLRFARRGQLIHSSLKLNQLERPKAWAKCLWKISLSLFKLGLWEGYSVGKRWAFSQWQRVPTKRGKIPGQNRSFQGRNLEAAKHWRKAFLNERWRGDWHQTFVTLRHACMRWGFSFTAEFSLTHSLNFGGRGWDVSRVTSCVVTSSMVIWVREESSFKLIIFHSIFMHISILWNGGRRRLGNPFLRKSFLIFSCMNWHFQNKKNVAVLSESCISLQTHEWLFVTAWKNVSQNRRSGEWLSKTEYCFERPVQIE